MCGHLCKDHVDTKHRIVHTPPQAFGENFKVQSQVIPQKSCQRRRWNCGIDEIGNILDKVKKARRGLTGSLKSTHIGII